IFSVVTNTGEFYSDKNKNKSFWEKGGRATAGIGMDVGVTGLTAGGALLGSMICPGPGTLIGGAIGGAVGVVASLTLENKIKDIGEKAGKWFGDQVENIQKSFSDLGNFVTGIFK
ncbi:transposase, partial [Bacillaceae bacterium Marseille-Q3522]|nr:transposase [Bacillaceae bacterium Marseille-Q3522]